MSSPPQPARQRTDLKVGFACNNRCLFCAQGDKRASAAAIDFAALVDRLRETFTPGRSLVLTGGEPTLRRDLAALVAAAHRIGYRQIQVQTNGRALAYPSLVARLLRAGVTEFSPALHGPSAELHDALTCAPGSFDQTVAGIANAVASGAGVITNTVVVIANLDRLSDTLDRLAELGVRHAQLAMVHPVGTAAQQFDQVVPRLEVAAPRVAAAVQRGRDRGLEVMVEALPACFLPGLEDALVEERIPETTVVDLDGRPFAFSDWRRDTGKAKGPPCQRCARRERCEGPWREYPEHHGWDGYQPISE